MIEYIFLTEQDHGIRVALGNMNGTEMIGSGSDFYVWKWTNPDPTDVTTIEADAHYIRNVQVE